MGRLVQSFIALFIIGTVTIAPLPSSANSSSSQIRQEIRENIKALNSWRKQNRLKAWTQEARLSRLAEMLAKKIAKDGFNSYSDRWLRDATAKVSYNAAEIQVSFFANVQSPKQLLKEMTKAGQGRDFLRNPNLPSVGMAYLSKETGTKFRQSSIQNIRVFITADEAKRAAYNWDKELLKEVNKFRAFYRLPPLKQNKKLALAAQKHADDMAVRDYFEHINLKGQGPGFRAKMAGYDYELILENLAGGQPTPKEVVKAWENSKDGHREAMLDRSITEAGFGYRFLPNDRGRAIMYHYWAMSMGKPRS